VSNIHANHQKFLVRLSEKSDPCNIYAEYTCLVIKFNTLHNIKMHKNTENPLK